MVTQLNSQRLIAKLIAALCAASCHNNNNNKRASERASEQWPASLLFRPSISAIGQIEAAKLAKAEAGFDLNGAKNKTH